MRDAQKRVVSAMMGGKKGAALRRRLPPPTDDEVERAVAEFAARRAGPQAGR